MQASTTANVGVPGRVRVSPSTKGLQTSACLHAASLDVGSAQTLPRALSGLFSALGWAHAAATHVGPGARERRAIVGSFRGLGPPRWRADPPPPARPPGRATIGWRIGPPAGGRSSYAAPSRSLVKLVADAPVRLGLGLAPGALLLADLASASSGAGQTPTPWSGDPAASARALTIAPRFRSDRATLSLTEIVARPGLTIHLTTGGGCPRPPSMPDGYSVG